MFYTGSWNQANANWIVTKVFFSRMSVVSNAAAFAALAELCLQCTCTCYIKWVNNNSHESITNSMIARVRCVARVIIVLCSLNRACMRVFIIWVFGFVFGILVNAAHCHHRCLYSTHTNAHIVGSWVRHFDYCILCLPFHCGLIRFRSISNTQCFHV